MKGGEVGDGGVGKAGMVLLVGGTGVGFTVIELVGFLW